MAYDANYNPPDYEELNMDHMGNLNESKPTSNDSVIMFPILEEFGDQNDGFGDSVHTKTSMERYKHKLKQKRNKREEQEMVINEQDSNENDYDSSIDTDIIKQLFGSISSVDTMQYERELFGDLNTYSAPIDSATVLNDNMDLNKLCKLNLVDIINHLRQQNGNNDVKKKMLKKKQFAKDIRIGLIN